MGASIANKHRTRVLCLGNDILADDAVGLCVARHLTDRLPEAVDVVVSMESGFRLLDHLLGVDRLLVVDAIQTGRAEPGTIYTLCEGDIQTTRGGSPHYVGLFEALATARRLGLPAAREVSIIAVEASDCVTVGGAMHPSVCAAVGPIVDLIETRIAPVRT